MAPDVAARLAETLTLSPLQRTRLEESG
jgi:hypothetical protein